MDLDGFMLREVGLDGERQMPCDIIPMWNIKANKRQQKIEQSKLNKNKHVDTEKRAVVTRGKAVGWGRAGEMGKGGQLYVDGWRQKFWC